MLCMPMPSFRQSRGLDGCNNQKLGIDYKVCGADEQCAIARVHVCRSASVGPYSFNVADSWLSEWIALQ